MKALRRILFGENSAAGVMCTDQIRAARIAELRALLAEIAESPCPADS
jgi:hypothetical protein